MGSSSSKAPPPPPPPKPRKSKMFQGTSILEEKASPIKPPKSQKKPPTPTPAAVPTSSPPPKPLKETSETSKSIVHGKVINRMAPDKGPICNSTVTCISILQAVEDTQNEDTYFAYKIQLRLVNTTKEISHRFSDFVEFHKEWKQEYPGVECELPNKKSYSALTEEDISRRCLELEVYLREVCQVSALVYYAAKFLNVEEKDLKSALKHKSQAVEDNRRDVQHRSLPKVRIAEVQNMATRSASSVEGIHHEEEAPKVEKPKQEVVSKTTTNTTTTTTVSKPSTTTTATTATTTTTDVPKSMTMKERMAAFQKN